MKADGKRNVTAIARVRCRPPVETITLDAGGEIRLVPGERRVYSVEAPGGGEAILAPADDVAGGWRLRRREDDESLGRTTPLDPDGAAGDGATILTADGRLFRSVAIVDDDPRIELRGWETPGAYLQARREGDDWVIGATPAGVGLSPASELLVLWIAHLTEPRPCRDVRGDT